MRILIINYHNNSGHQTIIIKCVKNTIIFIKDNRSQTTQVKWTNKIYQNNYNYI